MHSVPSSSSPSTRAASRLPRTDGDEETALFFDMEACGFDAEESERLWSYINEVVAIGRSEIERSTNALAALARIQAWFIANMPALKASGADIAALNQVLAESISAMNANAPKVEP